MFSSNHDSAIDAKGRVSVPAPFRAALGGANHVHVWPAFDGKVCLEAGGDELQDYYKSILAQMQPSNRAREAIAHAVFGRSVQLKMDEPGRIKIPEAMLDGAGITKTVKFVGAVDRFRIWSPEQYEAYDTQMIALARESMDALDAPFKAALDSGSLPGSSPRNGGEG
ncbi:MAG: division/cell wall cluster transcriptional repressor MraZ [Pseudomonadota bacterium]